MHGGGTNIQGTAEENPIFPLDLLRITAI